MLAAGFIHLQRFRNFFKQNPIELLIFFYSLDALWRLPYWIMRVREREMLRRAASSQTYVFVCVYYIILNLMVSHVPLWMSKRQAAKSISTKKPPQKNNNIFIYAYFPRSSFRIKIMHLLLFTLRHLWMSILNSPE